MGSCIRRLPFHPKEGVGPKSITGTSEMAKHNGRVISNSGCIEALNAFNNSQDTGFDQEQPPFDRPGPANVTQCQLARGNGKAIGVNLCN